MMKIDKLLAIVMALAMVLALAGCGSEGKTSAADASGSAAPAASASGSAADDQPAAEQTTVYIDIAASLEAVFVDKIIPEFEKQNPGVNIEYNTGSSGKLLSGIEEANGIGHDLFFSAGKKQVTTLDETDGLVVDGSIVNLLSNELCLVKGNHVETAVTGWDNLADAKSMAICGGSVPVGKYTRIALVSLGILPEAEDPAAYTTEEISAALNGMEIDEADDVEVAAAKAVEGSVDAATIYYSDYYNHKDELTILAQDDGTLTGNIVYPVCQVANPEATEAESAATQALLAFLQTDYCLQAFEEYCFIVNK